MRKLLHFNLRNLSLNRALNFGTYSDAMSTQTEIKPEWVKNQKGESFFVKRENETFQKFFSEQKLCDTEEEFQKCLEYMRKDLPQSFRINSSRPFHTKKLLSKILSSYSRRLVNEKPWSSGVWQCENSRWSIREDSDETLKNFHQFLMNERECGNISRQELVSMIPVFLLNVEPHHRVLDMCAAPGICILFQIKFGSLKVYFCNK